MGKGRLKDLLAASTDETIQGILESEAIPEGIKNIAELVVSEGTADIFGTVFGALAPRANSVRLNYKTIRFEHNVEDALALMSDQISELELKFEQLSEDIQKKFSNLYIGWLLDSLYDEKQEEKVPYYVNGYINLMSNDINDNLMLLYFDTINQLTQIDIEVLKLYDYDSEDDWSVLCDRNNLQYDQYKMIQEKLARLGLLNSKNDETRDKDMELIADYFKKMDKDNRNKIPKGVKIPDIKKPSRLDSYNISTLGRQYLLIMTKK